ncbi:MAG: MFS transporter [Steroidobacteraceae bacterium]
MATDKAAMTHSQLNLREWNTAYEWRAVLLLGLGFGLVGLDRWIIAPLFPAMMSELHLTYQDLGNLVGILGIAWGVFSIVMGNLADRYGRRRILIPALLLFSALSGFTGMASSLVTLVVIRAVMGAAEGAYLASSVAATSDASHPRRRGLNLGLQLSSFALLGFGIGPIIATQLMRITQSWRSVFMIVAVPGFILALLMWRIIREPPHLSQPARQPVAWGELFQSRNVIVAMLAILCAMSCIFVLGAMFPSYLIEYLQLDVPTMGVVTSALGFGGFIGEFVVPGVSDYIGRRLTAVIAFIGAALSTWLLMRTGAEPVQLFVLLLIVSFFCLGLLSLFTGAVAAEAVPVALVSSAVGLISGTGEIFGGGVAPALAGLVAQRHGIQNVLIISLIGLSIGIVVSLFLKETAPRKVIGS